MIGNSAEPNRKRLFFAANLAMFMIGLGFAVRANIAVSLQRELFDRLDLANSTHMVGQGLGITITGFAVTLLFGSALVDLVGGRRMLAESLRRFRIDVALLPINGRSRERRVAELFKCKTLRAAD